MNPQESYPSDAILKEHLLAIGPLRRDRVDFPGTSISIDIARPASIDPLLDAAACDPEQNLPYWAELWPSGIALAAAITRQPKTFSAVRVLEIGCGLGVTAAAALRAGADLLATDYALEALALCALNTRRLAHRKPQFMQINWRRPPEELFAQAAGGFPIVLAADVLYEARDVDPLSSLVDRLVAPGGELWLAEPGRRPAERFFKDVCQRGWRGTSEQYCGPWPDPDDNRKGVVVSVHRLRKAPS